MSATLVISNARLLWLLGTKNSYYLSPPLFTIQYINQTQSESMAKCSPELRRGRPRPPLHWVNWPNEDVCVKYCDVIKQQGCCCCHTQTHLPARALRRSPAPRTLLQAALINKAVACRRLRQLSHWGEIWQVPAGRRRGGGNEAIHSFLSFLVPSSRPLVISHYNEIMKFKRNLGLQPVLLCMILYG